MSRADLSFVSSSVVWMSIGMMFFVEKFPTKVWGARPDLQLPDGSPEGAYVQEVKPGQIEVNVCLAQPDFAPSVALHA